MHLLCGYLHVYLFLIVAETRTELMGSDVGTNEGGEITEVSQL